MLSNKTIGVVVPAFNEELLIVKTLGSMPAFVDTIIVIDDASSDRTHAIIKKLMVKDKRIVLLLHKENKGLGRSLIDGYSKAVDLKLDVVAVMAGDNQMHPDDLESVVLPVASGVVDYAKGNRLFHQDIGSMPKYRFLGNNLLTFLTKFSTGYWRLVDPQCGYTAISHAALSSIPFRSMTKRYGYNADLLNMLNIQNFKVQDVSVRPVYSKEKSKINVPVYSVKISFLLSRLFFRRMWNKYFLREFHPLIFFYLFSGVNGIISVASLIYIILNFSLAPQTSVIIFFFSTMMGVFSLFFGMWLDMEDNKRLWV
jgi:glycosyltransferase involved in cell wall biosynthesis